MTYRGLYVDDDNTDFGELLTSKELKLTFSSDIRPGPIKKLISAVQEYKPDVLAMDYRLDENQKEFDGENNYRAGGVAQLLREDAVNQPGLDFPIVLVSNENKIATLFNPDRTAHDLFDAWYAKEFITTSLVQVQKEILALIHGYRCIRDCRGKPDFSLLLLTIKNEEWADLGAGDLVQEIEEKDLPTHVIARHVLTKVIRRPGLLLSPEDTFARLGIAPNDPNLPALWDRLRKDGLGYDGIFSEGWPRIWRHRFDAWSEDKLGRPLSAIPGEDRVKKLAEKLGMNLTPAISKWTKKSKEFFSFACASCRHPTEQMNSVAALESSIPSYAERKRICFNCVMTDEYLKERLKISSHDESIARKVKSGEIKGG